MTTGNRLPRSSCRRLSNSQLLEHLEPRVLLSITFSTASGGILKVPSSFLIASSSGLQGPNNLSTVVKSGTSVQLNWTDRDSQALGYDVLRSTDGVHFTQLAQLNSTIANTYLDTSALSGHLYYYEVEDFRGSLLSKPSNIAKAATPLNAPANLKVTINGSALSLTWTGEDSAATSYYILRSTNNSSFSRIAQVNANTTSYTDQSVAADKTYYYEVQAFDAVAVSPYSNIVSATAQKPATPLNAPANLNVTISGNYLNLAWTPEDSNATGYYIFRSTNNSSFSLLTQTNASTTAYTDQSVAAGQTYYYKVEAFNSVTTSPFSNTAYATVPQVIPPLNAPANLNVTINGTYLNLAWTPEDSNATGYYIFRSTNNSSFSLLTQVNAGTTAYTDQSVAAGQIYYYKVEAFNSVTTSPFSNTAFATAPNPAPAGTVTIVTRYGDELVVTATGSADSIFVVQSGSTLTITADGSASSYALPAAGLFVYTRGGTDSITIDSSVTLRTTVETIDAAPTTILSHGSNVSVWMDSTDSFSGSATVHSVASFAGGVSKATGAALANPSDSGNTTVVNLSLWGTGPVAADVNQGAVGDCYFLSSLAAFAQETPAQLMQSAVDMGDGTYVVQFKSTFVRVSNSLPTSYAHPGANNTIWAVVLEKAFCDYRTGANTYASINSGWMSEVYADFNINSTTVAPTSYSDASLYSLLSSDLSSGKAVTAGTKSSGTQLVANHAYTIVSVSNVNGVNYYTVRNPWGIAGDSLENSQGYATLTYAQITANFMDLCLAV